MQFRGIAETDNALNEAIATCGLNSLVEKFPRQLSGGQKQRACLARALLCQPDLILMDEPLSALDHKAKQEAIQYLQAFKAKTNTPILYVTHSVEELSQLADNVLVLEQGNDILFGPTLETFAEHSELFESSEVASVFEAVVIELSEEHRIAKAQLLHDNQPEIPHVWLPSARLTQGKQIRLRVSARDVSISLAHNTQQSILNTLPAVISRIQRFPQSSTGTVSLAVGANTLHAHITLRSLDQLKLHTGQPVWAQVKALSVFD